VGFILSAIINKQNFYHAVLGYDGRHMGILTHVAILLLLVSIRNSSLKIRDFIFYGLWPILIVSLIYGYIQKYGMDPLTWAETDRTVLTLGNSDFAAQLFAVLLVVPIFHLLDTKNWTVRIANISVLAMIIDLGLYTQAFQFRVVGVLTIVTFLALVYFDKRNQVRLKNQIIVVILVSLVSLLYTILRWDRLDLISRTGAEDRVDSVLSGVKIFASHPIFGVGIEQFWRFDPFYRNERQALRNGPSVISDKAHNIFVDIFATGGVLTGIPFLLMVILTVTMIYKLLNTELPKERKLKVALVASIWVSYVIEMFITTDNVFIMMLSYVALAILMQNLRSEGNLNLSSNKILVKNLVLKSGIVTTTAIMGLTVTLFVSINSLQNSYELKLIGNGKITDGQQILETVYDFPNQKGAEAIAVSLLRDIRSCPLVKPISEELLRINPRSSQALYFLAICADTESKQAEALKYMERAIALQPLNNVYSDALFRLQISLKKFDDAKKTLTEMKRFDSKYPPLEDLEKLLVPVEQ
jgi:O-antigen ligase